MPVLIIPAVNNVDDVEMTRRHGDEIHLYLKNLFNNNKLKSWHKKCLKLASLLNG
ncbi:FIG00638531: hypothetical protein [Escherichia coli ISC7]|uniref:Uncharacterized protein n=3 Tax=Escherichia coli TaxID=562 RepID=W1EV49_ECOLX|nr:FIG00638531: hypothetical protein [Escherichia coli ISC7]